MGFQANGSNSNENAKARTVAGVIQIYERKTPVTRRELAEVKMDNEFLSKPLLSPLPSNVIGKT